MILNEISGLAIFLSDEIQMYLRIKCFRCKERFIEMINKTISTPFSDDRILS